MPGNGKVEVDAGAVELLQALLALDVHWPYPGKPMPTAHPSVAVGAAADTWDPHTNKTRSEHVRDAKARALAALEAVRERIESNSRPPALGGLMLRDGELYTVVVCAP